MASQFAKVMGMLLSANIEALSDKFAVVRAMVDSEYAAAELIVAKLVRDDMRQLSRSADVTLYVDYVNETMSSVTFNVNAMTLQGASFCYELCNVAHFTMVIAYDYDEVLHMVNCGDFEDIVGSALLLDYVSVELA
jgi:hypothetical protein